MVQKHPGPCSGCGLLWQHICLARRKTATCAEKFKKSVMSERDENTTGNLAKISNLQLPRAFRPGYAGKNQPFPNSSNGRRHTVAL